MKDLEFSVAANYSRIYDGICEAAVRSGRQPEDVSMLAVTKFVDDERITAAVRAGASLVGENRPQELVRKRELFTSLGVHMHLIGQLQTNKVKLVVGTAELIQSVDRESLALEIDRVAGRLGIVQDVLCEVNIGGEESKSGVRPEALAELLFMMSALPNLRVKGLMTVPPAVEGDAVRSYFSRMKRLFDDMKGLKLPNVSMETLSMGMSGDHIAAIAEGSTMVRIGTALFGPRDYGAAAHA